MNERDEDREEWMRLALAIWDSQFVDDEPKYSSNLIKNLNPAFPKTLSNYLFPKPQCSTLIPNKQQMMAP
ncbi:MAG: hypothetical protein AAB354_10190 [candidate division KSB1 bacterium]